MAGCPSLLVGFSLLMLGQLGSDPAAVAPTVDGPALAAPTDAPAAAPPELGNLRRHLSWPEVWGFAQGQTFVAGTRMAPNGFDYRPLFDLGLNLNIGLLPNKEFYLYGETGFWGQKATAGQTHGNLDFTKREFDLTTGVAWNYAGNLEFRFFGFAYNNLNRGISLQVPYGYNDGIGFENRFYFATDDPYDISRLSFVSVGYIPSKSLIGADGEVFKPGFFARAYLIYDLNFCNAYTYLDGQLYSQDGFTPRLLFLDAGVAARPFATLDGLEFRVGGTDTFDVGVTRNRGLGYIAIRLLW